MGLSAKIKSQVRSALNKIGDLATVVILTEKNVTEYDFATKLPVSTTPVTKITKGLLTSKNRQGSTGDSTITTQLLLSAEDISEPDIYDTVTIGSVVWNIVPPVLNNGYTVKLTIVKEAS